MSWEPGEQIFNLKALQQELDRQEPEGDMEGNRLRMVYIGTVMGMTPSGKFYTPWACGSVDACPECKGYGRVDNLTCMTCEGLGSREAFLDQQWYEQVEGELDKIGAWMESGEGDPCDLFVVQSADEDDEDDEDPLPEGYTEVEDANR